MKTKPILKAIAAGLLICSVMLFSQCRHAANKDGINGFLALFELQVKNTQTDSLQKDFDMPGKREVIARLINLLCNKTGLSKKSKPIFKVTINTSDNGLKDMAGNITLATFAVKFSRDTLGIGERSTTLSFKIKMIANNTFKIVEIDATNLLKDYADYENMVRSRVLTDADIYSPQTLAAFKVAQSLKSKYDSIPWFQHVGAATWYFVVKGKMNLSARYEPDTIPTYKMGLLNADQKEIIPVEFDLVHNIGATYPNLIEVEKDHKRGFYNTTGQVVLPVEYDQVLPVNNDDDLAILRKGNEYYHWKHDYTITDKDPNLKIADILPQIKAFGHTVKMNDKLAADVMESNSRDDHGSVYISPSYLVDWKLMPVVQHFKNPLRRNVEYEDASELYQLTFEGKTDNENWLTSVFYSIEDNYLGGREGLYEHKNVMVVNKKNNRIYGNDITSYLSESDGGSLLDDECRVSKLRAINDSLYEVVVGTNTYRELYDGKQIGGGPEFHYLQLKNDQMTELPVTRLFGFTKYVKMDDSYLRGCYEYIDDQKTASFNSVTPEMLNYMKNEIYAEYKYQFKDPQWIKIFSQDPKYDKYNASVDDSLTAVDKYNISFINQKLKAANYKKPIVVNKELAAQ